jgi:hypothetical protein
MWMLSAKIYKEISFQSIFSLRAGSSLPQRRDRDIRQIVRSARMSTLISKLVTTIFIAVFGVIVFLPMTTGLPSPAPPRELTVVGSVSAFFAVVLFLIVFMGLQVSTSFVSSKVVDILTPLPLSKREISNIVFLSFIRIFDIPLAASAAVYLAAYFLAGGSVFGGFISAVGITVTEIFALTLAIALAKFFYSKVAGGGGRSKWRTVSRFIFMLVWILPTFSAYFVVNFAEQIVQSFALFTQGLSSVLQVLALAYPFSYGLLVSYATFSQGIDLPVIILSAVSSIGYIFAAYYCLRWVTTTVREFGIGVTVSPPREVVRDTCIKPQIPWLGIIRKDLRVASRAPSYASLFLLPAMQTAILAISFSSFSDVGLATALGILTGISLITLLLPPTLLSIEGLASAYTRSLPMGKRTLISAKTLLSIFTYIISLVVLFVVGSLMGRDFSFILTFGAVHSLSVSAAAMLELKILVNKFWKEGFSVGNIYARLHSYILILIPGFLLVFAPIFGALVVFFASEQLVLPVFLAIAFSEFAIMSAFVALEK